MGRFKDSTLADEDEEEDEDAETPEDADDVVDVDDIDDEPGKDDIETADPSNVPVDVALAELDESDGALNHCADIDREHVFSKSFE